MDERQFKEILKKYQEGTCSEEEKALVESWYLKMTDESQTDDLEGADMDNAKKRIWKGVLSERPIRKQQKIIYTRVAVAATILMAIGLSFYFLTDQIAPPVIAPETVAYEDKVEPGGNKAYLTLADGQKIDLDEIEEGAVLEQQGFKVVKRLDGELVYEITGTTSDGMSSGNNTVETPIGGQYQVLLPDGTKVWLNSSSSLEYPIRFSATERKVKLTGEGYFEVASNREKPFRVVSGKQTIEVLGTKFNINTYKDESALKTTLLEGSVRVSLGNASRILKPGEQAIVGEGIRVEKVDTEQVIAWYKGDFYFDGAELKNIMRQIGRWYDVDIEYVNDVGNVRFGGSISRSKDIKEVLKVLSMTQGVNFKLEGRRVMVMH